MLLTSRLEASWESLESVRSQEPAPAARVAMWRLALVAWWARSGKPLLDRDRADPDSVEDSEGEAEEAPEAWTLQGPVRGLRWGTVRAARLPQTTKQAGEPALRKPG